MAEQRILEKRLQTVLEILWNNRLGTKGRDFHERYMPCWCDDTILELLQDKFDGPEDEEPEHEAHCESARTVWDAYADPEMKDRVMQKRTAP